MSGTEIQKLDIKPPNLIEYNLKDIKNELVDEYIQKILDERKIELNPSSDFIIGFFFGVFFIIALIVFGMITIAAFKN